MRSTVGLGPSFDPSMSLWFAVYRKFVGSRCSFVSSRPPYEGRCPIFSVGSSLPAVLQGAKVPSCNMSGLLQQYVAGKIFRDINQLMPDPKLAAQRLLNDFLCAIISLSAFYDIAQILARGLHIATEMCAGDIILRPACKTLFQGNGCGGQGTSWFHHRGSWSYAPLDHTALSPFHRQLTAGRSPIPLFDFHGCSRAEI